MARVYDLKHDPDAVLPYGFDWAAKGWLDDGETITESSWSVDPSGELTVNSESHTDTKTKVWVEGGNPDTLYWLTNHIKTSDGKEDDRSIKLLCKER